MTALSEGTTCPMGHVPISAPSVRFPKNVDALPGFFSCNMLKKAWYSLENFGKSHRCCRYWHMQSFSPIGQVVPSERAVISQWEVSRPIGTDCMYMYMYIFTIFVTLWLFSQKFVKLCQKCITVVCLSVSSP